MEEITLRAMGGNREHWRIRLQPDALQLTSTTGDAFSVERSEEAARLLLLDAPPRRTLVTLWRPGGKLQFLAGPSESQVLRQWQGPLTEAHLRALLQRRYGHVGLVALLTLLPFARLVSWIARGYTLSPVAFVGPISASIFPILWLLARFRPHPRIFLLEALLFLAYAGSLLFALQSSSVPVLLILIVALLIYLATASAALFGRFRHLSQPAP